MFKFLLSAWSYNYIITVSLFAWIAAQILKVVVFLIINKKFSAERLVGAGGWPSSHSALVSAMLVALAKTQGASSTIFSVAFVFASVVMYDAMGVRREAGNQAKVINLLLKERVEKLRSMAKAGDEKDFVEEIGQQLKEMVGHTPFQVLCGALLGLVTGLLVPVF